MTLDELAGIANALVPEVDARTRLNAHRFAVQCGILYEMPPNRPSLPEIGMALGCGHPRVYYGLQRWRELPWRERHGWLMLAEGRAR